VIVTASLAIFPVLLWVLVYYSLPHVAVSWDLDFGYPIDPRSFLYIYDRYCVLFRTIFWLGLIGTGLMLKCGEIMSAQILAASSLCSLLFQAILLWFYEMYVHTRYDCEQGIVARPAYPTGRYALTMALGISTIGYFVLGVVSAIVEWR